MNRIHFFIVTGISLILFSCVLPSKKITGFTINSENKIKPVSEFWSIAIEKKITLTGWIVHVEHENTRSILLFIPSENPNKLKQDLKKCVRELENSNNPSNWSMYYIINRVPNFYDFNNIKGEVVDFYYQGLLNSVFGQTGFYLYESKTEKVKEYKLHYKFIEKQQFCMASIDIKEMNRYNSVRHIEDGPPKKNINPPFYIFSEENKRMIFLFSYSNVCE